MRKQWLSGVILVLLAAPLCAQITAVPPAANRASPAKVESAAALLTPAGAPSYAIDLPPASPEEQSVLQRRSAATAALTAKRHMLAIGFSRKLPTGNRSITSLALPWQAVSGGGRAARIVVDSPGAAAIRLGLSLPSAPAGVTLRFAGSGAQVYGPYPAAAIARAKTYWSPPLEGERATLEIYLPPGVAPEAIDLRMPKISHMVVAGASLSRSEPVSDIGRAGGCEVDVACVATAALSSQARSVAKLVFTDAEGTFLCTGTLLNDSTGSNTPYLYTASHCMDSQEAASSLVTYWFFDAVSCGNRATPAYATGTGGATLLGRSVDADWALVRLNSPPPANAVFSAWRADPLVEGAEIGVLHHPAGDLKKVSVGTMPSYFSFSDATSFTSARYTTGSTEPGSSGAGLITLGGGGFYELRGGLFAGDGSCTQPDGFDVYSRLDLALPLLAPYLTPNAPNPAKTTLVVEYYFAGYDDYFITADPAEIRALDGGALPGWVRTGLTFLAYTDPAAAPAGAQPVCRFYLLPQYGDSHFYSADPSECAATAAKFAGSWVEESAALFYIQLPDPTTGACPANTRPVYRFVNRANQIHHRYTAEVDVRNCLYYGSNPNTDKDVDCSAFTGSWQEEGFGSPPDAPVMCAPG